MSDSATWARDKEIDERKFCKRANSMKILALVNSLEKINKLIHTESFTKENFTRLEEIETNLSELICVEAGFQENEFTSGEILKLIGERIVV